MSRIISRLKRALGVILILVTLALILVYFYGIL
jgi:hypothetical protein